MPIPAKLAIIVVGLVITWFLPPVQKRLAMIQANAAFEAVDEGQLEAAAVLAAQAQATAQAHGWTDVSARAAWAATLVASKRGQWDEAAAACQRALAEGGPDDLQGKAAELQFTLGSIQLRQGHARQAVATFEAALAQLRAHHATPSSEELGLYASALDAVGRKDDARKARAQAGAEDDTI